MIIINYDHVITYFEHIFINQTNMLYGDLSITFIYFTNLSYSPHISIENLIENC